MYLYEHLKVVLYVVQVLTQNNFLMEDGKKKYKKKNYIKKNSIRWKNRIFEKFIIYTLPSVNPKKNSLHLSPSPLSLKT